MIDEVDQQVAAWIRGVVGDDVPISFELPAKAAGPVVSAYLLELRDHPAPAGTPPAPLQVLLSYLVTTASDSPESAHRLLGQLVFSALEHPEYRPDLEPPPAPLWSALGVSPRPAFFLRVPCRRERPARPSKRVLTPLVVTTSPMGPIVGRVLGPGDHGIPGARVELPALRRSTRTDGHGRFLFAAVPAEPLLKHFVVQAKGIERSFAAECRPGAPDPVLIRIHSLEG
jgi:hypothetical protein